MDKKITEDVIYSLLETSKSGDIIWSCKKASDTEYYLSSTSLDKKTKFESNIRVNDKGSLRKCSGYFVIYNGGLTDGKQILTDNIYSNLEEYLYNIHIKPNLQIKDDDRVMLDILSDLGKVQIRDKKISDILGFKFWK